MARSNSLLQHYAFPCELTEFLADSDFKGLAVLGHDLKGTGASYGFPDLTRIGIAMEHSAKQPDPETLNAQLSKLKEYQGQVQPFAKI